MWTGRLVRAAAALQARCLDTGAALRVLRQITLARLAQLDCKRQADLAAVTHGMTWLAEVTLDIAWARVSADLDALHGAPGIRSARYAGPGADDAANNARLLAELDAVPDGERGARYRCAMVFVRWPLDPAPIVCQASWEGRISRLPRGAGGFGYDPLFLVGDGETMAAELDPVRKNQLSHRGKALRALVATLTEPGGGS